MVKYFINQFFILKGIGNSFRSAWRNGISTSVYRNRIMDVTISTDEPVTQSVCVCVVQVKTGAFLYISLFLHFFTVYNMQGFIRSYIDPLIFIEIKLTQFLEFIVEFELRDNHDVKMCVVFLFLGGVPFSGVGWTGGVRVKATTQVPQHTSDRNFFSPEYCNRFFSYFHSLFHKTCWCLPV